MHTLDIQKCRPPSTKKGENLTSPLNSLQRSVTSLLHPDSNVTYFMNSNTTEYNKIIDYTKKKSVQFRLKWSNQDFDNLISYLHFKQRWAGWEWEWKNQFSLSLFTFQRWEPSVCRRFLLMPKRNIKEIQVKQSWSEHEIFTHGYCCQ